LRYFFRRYVPPFNRVLLVESGARSLYEALIPDLYKQHGDQMRLDLLVCFDGAPSGFRPGQGDVWRVTDYPDSDSRARLFAELKANQYEIVGIICSDEAIMTKWKWAIAAKLPSKVFILNENGDYLWLDWGHAKTIWHFILFRAGLAGAGAVRTILRLVLFPFALAYLIAFAAWAHLRRRPVNT
jgi:hypothetical protein